MNPINVSVLDNKNMQFEARDDIINSLCKELTQNNNDKEITRSGEDDIDII